MRFAHWSDNLDFYLLDSRAGLLSVETGQLDLKKVHNDPGKFVLFVGTADEVCEAATTGEYGDLCVVSDTDYVIRFDWAQDGKTWSKYSGDQFNYINNVPTVNAK